MIYKMDVFVVIFFTAFVGGSKLGDVTGEKIDTNKLTSAIVDAIAKAEGKVDDVDNKRNLNDRSNGVDEMDENYTPGEKIDTNKLASAIADAIKKNEVKIADVGNERILNDRSNGDDEMDRNYTPGDVTGEKIDTNKLTSAIADAIAKAEGKVDDVDNKRNLNERSNGIDEMDVNYTPGEVSGEKISAISDAKEKNEVIVTDVDNDRNLDDRSNEVDETDVNYIPGEYIGERIADAKEKNEVRVADEGNERNLNDRSNGLDETEVNYIPGDVTGEKIVTTKLDALGKNDAKDADVDNERNLNDRSNGLDEMDVNHTPGEVTGEKIDTNKLAGAIADAIEKNEVKIADAGNDRNLDDRSNEVDEMDVNYIPGEVTGKKISVIADAKENNEVRVADEGNERNLNDRSNGLDEMEVNYTPGDVTGEKIATTKLDALVKNEAKDGDVDNERNLDDRSNGLEMDVNHTPGEVTGEQIDTNKLASAIADATEKNEVKDAGTNEVDKMDVNYIRDENSLVCPPGIRKFSTGAFKSTYYECLKIGDSPVLRRCPASKIYCAKTQRCIADHRRTRRSVNSNGASPKDDELRDQTMPVLGRTVQLGCLFDAKRNRVKPADRFWDENTIKKNKSKSRHYSSRVSFYAVQSTYDRLSHMDIKASLKMDFLGGLVSVSGSAAYLKDTVESEHTVAYVLKGHYITGSEILPTSTTTMHNNLCDLNDATHVVTAITYGMDAYFVFRKTVRKHESREDIAGSLEIAIKSIPSIKVDAKVGVSISGELRESVASVEAKVFGDFVLNKQPTTYEDSVLLFANLTNELGKAPNYSRASKMKMMLTPITRFCKGSTVILLAISNSLIHQVTQMLDKIEQTKRKAKTLAQTDVVIKYSPLSKMMNEFCNELELFEGKVKSNLTRILPNIRGGGEGGGETELIEVLTTYLNSPFNYDTSKTFLNTRSREINQLSRIMDVDIFNPTQVEIVDYVEGNDLDKYYEFQHGLQLNFNILTGKSVVEDFLKGKDVDESKSWFHNNYLVSSLGNTFDHFMKFAAANKESDEFGYLFAMHETKDKYVNIQAWKDKKKLTDDFTFPEFTPKMTILLSTHNSITFQAERTDNRWVTGFVVSLWKYGRKYDHEEKTFKFKGDDTSTYEVTGLVSNEVYVFMMKYSTVMGFTPYGPETPAVVIKPCSPPSNLNSRKITSSSFEIYWDRPIQIGDGVVIADYNVTLSKVAECPIGAQTEIGKCCVFPFVYGKKTYKKCTKVAHDRYWCAITNNYANDGKWSNCITGDALAKVQRTNNQRNIKFGGLAAATSYRVSVQAVANTQKYNVSEGEKVVTPASAKAWIATVTSPDPPPRLRLVTVSFHSVNLAWSLPTKIAVGAEINEYVVRYVIRNNLGSKSLGSPMEKSSGKSLSTALQDLVQGSTYAVSVKVITSMGTSAYSPVLIVKTKFKQTDLDKLRSSVEQEIQDSVSDVTSNLNSKINAETKRITEVDTKLNKKINVESKRITNVDTKLTKKINDEKKRITEVRNSQQTLRTDLETNKRKTNGLTGRVQVLERNADIWKDLYGYSCVFVSGDGTGGSEFKVGKQTGKECVRACLEQKKK